MTPCWLCGSPGGVLRSVHALFHGRQVDRKTAAEIVADPETKGNTMHVALDELEWCVETLRQALPSVAGTWERQATVEEFLAE